MNGDKKSLRILVVDDEPDIAKLVAKTLNYFGHTAKTSPNGEIAIELIKDYKPNIALVDISMPGMSGYELARKLRQWEAETGNKIKLIALTGYGQESDKEKTKAAGFDLHLVKPIDMDTLNDTINDLKI
jgi:CheY-like chemotaxis protein